MVGLLVLKEKMKTNTSNKQLVTLVIPFLFLFNACQSEPLAGVETSQAEDLLAEEQLELIEQEELEIAASIETDVEVSESTIEAEVVTEDAPISPCDINENLYGEEVRVSGEVVCFGRDDEGSILFELVDGSCKVYVFIDKTMWEGWAQEARDRIAAASQLTVTGLLEAYGDESEIEVLEPPV